MTTATATTWERSERGTPVSGGVKALSFIVLWVAAIVLWVIAPSITVATAGAFVIDTGLVLASVGFGLLFVDTRREYNLGLVFAIIGIVLFAAADFAEATPVVYTLRMLIPFLALLMPVNRFLNNFRVWS